MTSLFLAFFCTRSKVSWMNYTRSFLSSAVFYLFQITKKSFAQKCSSVNKVISYLKETKGVAHCYPFLLQEQLHNKVFAESTFANNEYLHSRLDYIILLTDGIKAYTINMKERRAIESHDLILA